MPELLFEKVLFVSSEEKAFPAEHLLKRGEFKKWKCLAGDPKAIVILQLPEDTRIEQINIGNEGSAFVEIFASKSSIKEEDFQLILPASSFMTPIESRNSQNLSKVRLFSKENLIKTTLEQEWNVIKVVCTQPFNKNISYGLSFITLHSPQLNNAPQVELGEFPLKSCQEKNTSFKVGSLFQKSKQKQATSSASNGSNIPTNQDSFTKKSIESKDFREQLHKTEVEFCHLMKDVVFVLSGFKNPLRGELRNKALSMGAKYKADWDEDCTHLICAFENTPKFHLVKEFAKIVRHEWIKDSFDKKQLMPWRNYIFDGAPSPKRTTSTHTICGKSDEYEQKNNSENCVEDNEDDSTDIPTDSDCESGDEIERAERQNLMKIPIKDETKSCTRHDSIDGLPELPNFFEGLKFFLYGEFANEDRRYMKRHIIAYNGSFSEYMNIDVTTVISSKKWDSNFDEAIRDYPHLVFLRPEWVLECIDHQKMIPFKSYQLCKQ